MFARVTFAAVQPGKMNDNIAAMKNYVVPAIQNQKGYEGLLFLVNSETNEAISIGLWDTEDDMKASEDNGFYRQAVSRCMPYMSGQPDMKRYEVLIRDEVPMRTAPLARVSFGSFQPGKTSEIDKIQEESISPACKSQKGYDGYIVLSNNETGEGMTVSLWDSEADMKGCEENGYYRQQVAKLVPYLSTQPDMKHFDVSIRDEARMRAV